MSCWRWASTPSLPVIKPNYRDDTRCYPPVDPDADLIDKLEFILTTNGAQTDNAAIVATVPVGVSAIKLGHVGGRVETAKADAGLLIWVGSSEEPLGFVEFTTGTGTIGCGIGAVSSMGDHTNDTLVGNPFGSAWLCQ